MTIPRPEHPRPQFMRSRWENLNGTWQFEIDNTCSGEDRGLQKPGVCLSSTITVPFCPESKLSGVGNTDFMNGVWYKRTLSYTPGDQRVFLHFGAVDYRAKVFVNGLVAGSHKGGYTSFALDITALLQPGDNEITVFAQDDTRDRSIPSGKQSMKYASYGCYYTRCTGIWQTVWLEYRPVNHIAWVRYEPNIHAGSVTVEASFVGCGRFTCDISYEGKPMGSYSQELAAGTQYFTVQLAEKHLWEPGAGRLYDVTLTFGEDRVSSYFGLRQVRLDGYKFLINEKSVFQRLVLDQGYFPDGIYTAPTEEDLIADIQRGLECGFNGARLHEKIFEERYLYHADRLGYLVWGEYPDWGLDRSRMDGIYSVLPEWMEAVQRDRNHPAIIGWCPQNETWDVEGRRQLDGCISLVYDVTKQLDPTRPCIDTSGHFHVKTDIFDVHCYEQDPKVFKENYDKLMTEGTLFDRMSHRQTYEGQATFVSEYGGIRWAAGENDPSKQASWGYGNDPKNLEEFYERYKGLTDALLDNCKMFGLCYTQLTDVEQEQNGLYTYDRKPKFDNQRLSAIMQRKAAIED